MSDGTSAPPTDRKSVATLPEIQAWAKQQAIDAAIANTKQTTGVPVNQEAGGKG